MCAPIKHHDPQACQPATALPITAALSRALKASAMSIYNKEGGEPGAPPPGPPPEMGGGLAAPTEPAQPPPGDIIIPAGSDMMVEASGW